MGKKPVSRHALYERLEQRYEGVVVERLLMALEIAGPPPGWYRSGRSKRGRPEEFGWKPLAVVLTLMFYWGFTYREMATHLRYDRWLLKEVGLKRAPSKSVLQKAVKRMPQEWLKKVNETAIEMWGKNEDAPGI